MNAKPNHLINETSPYLLQHAYNPVDWYPWGKTALDKAKQENKPILLSIGYAACHWCHVMEHESFEDEETAKLMNELFVNIKVDREERPDLDKIYQTAHYVLTQQGGGWPLTIFLTPDDLTPFFSGTYFPRQTSHQLPAFKEVLKGISEIYQNRMPDIRKQNAELAKLLQQQITTNTDIHITDLPIHLAHKTLQHSFDKIYGGFGGAPKFPHPNMLEFLLQDSSPMTAESLQHMANGGLYDQLGGGFYRYSVDVKWEIPHFEKMLYDNAQLLYLYALASKQYHNAHFANIAKATANWVINHMQSPEGGYYSSLDADSEGHEGKYYVWTPAEIEKLLSREEYYIVRLHYGLDLSPNFEQHWHLNITQPLAAIAGDFNVPISQAENLLQSAKEKLLTARSERVAPKRDEKILTSWNALMIKGMLVAGQVLHEPNFIESAQRAIHFIYKNLWQNKRLLANYKNGKATIPAYLDDYAFMLDALLTSLEISWNSDNLQFAIDLADGLLTHFTDSTNGGFFFTADDHEKLLYRPKNFMDEATPSGNAIAIRSFLTLYHLLGDTKYIIAAEKTLLAAWASLAKYPAEHASLLMGLKDYLSPSQMIIIRGKDNNEINLWLNTVKKLNSHVYAIPVDAPLPTELASRKSQIVTCAYICQGTQCLDVITDLEVLKTLSHKQD